MICISTREHDADHDHSFRNKYESSLMNYDLNSFFASAGGSRDIGTCLTRIVIRHRALESRMKTLSG